MSQQSLNLVRDDSDDEVERARELVAMADALADGIRSLNSGLAVETLNTIRRSLHGASPLRHEPVDLVEWVPFESVEANDYNPNSVAPPEMELLRVSIAQDGYTQPIVTFLDQERREVVDGFHRNRVGRECADVRNRVRGYLPVVTINQDREGRSDRIAATIRHNRARGRHQVQAMSDIVVELKRRNWDDEKIARELGMDQDEILRLCQITGLAELFADQEFSHAWDIEGRIDESDFAELSDDPSLYDDSDFRVAANTSDEGRIFHTYEKWECHKAGFYDSTKEGMTKAECEEAYRLFLSDPERFREALRGVVSEWRHSCEHYLTNGAMNRIAWLGQAAACYAIGIPAAYRSGFNLLTEAQQADANNVALEALNAWLTANGRSTVTLDEAYSGNRQQELY